MMKWEKSLGTFCLAFTLCATFLSGSQNTYASASSVQAENVAAQKAQLAQVKAEEPTLTLEAKVGQFFIVRPESLNGAVTLEALEGEKQAVTTVTPKMVKYLQKYKPGGVCLFAKNLKTPEQTKAFIQELQAKSPVPLIMAVDEEGGRVARIANNPQMQVQQVGPMGDIKTKDAAYAAGKYMGTYLQDLGFNLDFAPVADVLTNPENKLIGKRSFGSNPALCGTLAAEVVKGLHSAGIGSCVKHFPGHGGFEHDSHVGLSVTYRNEEQLQLQELVSFKKALSADTDCVMIAHMLWPEVHKSNLPASLDSYFVEKLLRKALGFQGLIITDSLGMKAVSRRFGSGEAAVLALQAGNDLLLLPEDFPKAYKTVLQAVKSGKISEAQLNRAVDRIRDWKIKRGIIK